MADFRRRSSRRGKKREVYSENDLVQIPHNSTTIIGRLVSKLIEQPSVRWLVTFDDIPNRKDAEILEEALGPVVGRVDVVPKTITESAINADNASVVTPCTEESVPVSIVSESIATRSQRRKSNSSNSPDDGGTKVSSKKRKGRSSPPHVPKEEEDSAIESAQETTMLSPKLTSRELRSRRRRGLSVDEVPESAVPTSTNNANATIAATVTNPKTASDSTINMKIPAVPTVTVPSQSKRPVVQNVVNSKSKNENPPKNKKMKTSGSDRRKHDVLEVPLLTGTLYLYRGAHRRVEFVRKH